MSIRVPVTKINWRFPRRLKAMTHMIFENRKLKDHLNALRAKIDEAEASGISLRSVDEVFAEARAIARSHGLMRVREDKSSL
jgi:hypothetical protein